MPLPHSNSWPCMAVTVRIWTHDLQVMGQFLLHLLGSWISLALVHLYYVMIVSGCLCEVRGVCVRVRWSLKSIPIGDCKCLWSRSPIRDHRPQGLYLLLYLSRVCVSQLQCVEVWCIASECWLVKTVLKALTRDLNLIYSAFQNYWHPFITIVYINIVHSSLFEFYTHTLGDSVVWYDVKYIRV